MYYSSCHYYILLGATFFFLMSMRFFSFLLPLELIFFKKIHLCFSNKLTAWSYDHIQLACSIIKPVNYSLKAALYDSCRCFRDEDLRADRQPEFTQLDMEIAFTSMEDMLKLNEDLMRHVCWFWHTFSSFFPFLSWIWHCMWDPLTLTCQWLPCVKAWKVTTNVFL